MWLWNRTFLPFALKAGVQTFRGFLLKRDLSLHSSLAHWEPSPASPVKAWLFLPQRPIIILLSPPWNYNDWVDKSGNKTLKFLKPNKDHNTVEHSSLRVMCTSVSCHCSLGLNQIWVREKRENEKERVSMCFSLSIPLQLFLVSSSLGQQCFVDGRALVPMATYQERSTYERAGSFSCHQRCFLMVLQG